MRYLDFFKRQLILMHFSGIPVRMDYRWFPVFALMSLVTAISIDSFVDDSLVSLSFSLVTTFVFCVSIFLHEYAHAAAARRAGIHVLEIILHPFGGLTRLKREPDTLRAEFQIAIAGPLASFLIAAFFAFLTTTANYFELGILRNLAFMLALLNFLLGIFNLFPGYPLDGGKILRSHLWRRGNDINKATILTARFGQVIGAALVVFGVFNTLLRSDFVNGFWTIIVGWFLFDAAKVIVKEITDMESLSVEKFMIMPIIIDPAEKVQYFVDNILPLHRQSVFPVAENFELYGMLMLEDLKKISQEIWNTTKVRDIMRPVKPDYFVEPETLLSDAKQLMRVNGIGALGVIDDRGKLVGFVRRGRTKKRS